MEVGLELGLGSVGLRVWERAGCGERDDEEWRPGAEGARCSVRGLATASSLAEEEVAAVKGDVVWSLEGS